jgi:hypothetical protein
MYSLVNFPNWKSRMKSRFYSCYKNCFKYSPMCRYPAFKAWSRTLKIRSNPRTWKVPTKDWSNNNKEIFFNFFFTDNSSSTQLNCLHPIKGILWPLLSKKLLFIALLNANKLLNRTKSRTKSNQKQNKLCARLKINLNLWKFVKNMKI